MNDKTAAAGCLDVISLFSCLVLNYHASLFLLMLLLISARFLLHWLFFLQVRPIDLRNPWDLNYHDPIPEHSPDSESSEEDDDEGEGGGGGGDGGGEEEGESSNKEAT